ncbi:hypothetical protein TNCV_638941 [Trichonephila clavipes]|nr:hypothetical protein TNCV_638941 [Trichonephila clavipes]
MYHDEIPERCKLNFTEIVDDALRIAGELFPKQTLKKYIRKEVEIDTDGRGLYFVCKYDESVQRLKSFRTDAVNLDVMGNHTEKHGQKHIHVENNDKKRKKGAAGMPVGMIGLHVVSMQGLQDCGMRNLEKTGDCPYTSTRIVL